MTAHPRIHTGHVTPRSARPCAPCGSNHHSFSTDSSMQGGTACRSNELSFSLFNSTFCVVIFRFSFCISVLVLPGRRNNKAYPGKLPNIRLSKSNFGKHLQTWKLIWALQPPSFCPSKTALIWEYQCPEKMRYGCI